MEERTNNNDFSAEEVWYFVSLLLLTLFLAVNFQHYSHDFFARLCSEAFGFDDNAASGKLKVLEWTGSVIRKVF